MKLLFEKKFLKEISHLGNPKLQSALEQVILEAETAKSISQIKNMKKLKGYKNAFRIKVGDYRIGLLINSDTIVFVRFLHRKDVYQYFP